MNRKSNRVSVSLTPAQNINRSCHHAEESSSNKVKGKEHEIGSKQEKDSDGQRKGRKTLPGLLVFPTAEQCIVE